MQALASRKMRRPGFSSIRELVQHPGVVRQMLNDTHDDNRIELPIRAILQEIALDHFPVVTELFRAAIKISIDVCELLIPVQ